MSMFPPLEPVRPAFVEQADTAPFSEFDDYDDQPATVATVEEMARAPEYLGVHCVHSEGGRVSVGSVISFEIEQFDEGGESRYCLRAEQAAQRHPAHAGTQHSQSTPAGEGEQVTEPDADSAEKANREDDNTAGKVLAESERKRVSVLLPKSKSAEQTDALSTHHVGSHRFRIIRGAWITPPTQQHSSAWSADQLQPSAYALSLAVDAIPYPHPCYVSTKKREVTVLRPLAAGESVEVWMSTRQPAQQHIVFGKEVSDQLDMALRTELLSPAPALHLQTLDVQAAREALAPGEEERWLWTASLDLLRLADIEAHAVMPLTWASDKTGRGAGALRPETRTKSKRGRFVAVGDYRVEVRHRLGTLLHLGAHSAAAARAQAPTEDDAPEHEGLGAEEGARAAGAGGERAVETEYPLLDLAVLLRVSRVEVSEAEGFDQALEALLQ